MRLCLLAHTMWEASLPWEIVESAKKKLAATFYVDRVKDLGMVEFLQS